MTFMEDILGKEKRRIHTEGFMVLLWLMLNLVS